MSTRLLTFLSDIEHSLAADDPEPNGGSWDNSRSISYHLGLARLTLASKDPISGSKPLGEIVLQASTLADGSACFKATLHWEGSQETTLQSVFEKPNVEWRSAARRVAALWQGGAPAPTIELGQEQPNFAVAS